MRHFPRLAVILLLATASCKRKDMHQGEAEAKSARIFGTRAWCTGGSDGDRRGYGDWTCFSVEIAPAGGPLVYKPTPIVTCIDGECKKITAEGEYQCSTMTEAPR